MGLVVVGASPGRVVSLVIDFSAGVAGEASASHLWWRF